MMCNESNALRAQCHKDITNELDRLFAKNVDRAKLLEFEILYNGAQSGEWKLRNGQIVKGDKPVNDPKSLRFLVRCWAIVPALLAMVYRLEIVIIDLIAKRLSAKAEELRAKAALDKHRAEIAKGQTTGPKHEFDLLVGCAKLGVFNSSTLSNLFRRWMAGHSIEAEVIGEYADALKRENELCTQLESAPDRIKEYFRAYCRKQDDKP